MAPRRADPVVVDEVLEEQAAVGENGSADEVGDATVAAEVANDKVVAAQAADETATGGADSDAKLVEDKTAAEDNAADEKAIDEKAVDGKVAVKKAAKGNGKVVTEKVVADEVAETESEATAEKSAGDKGADEKVAAEKSDDDKSTDADAADEKAVAEKSDDKSTAAAGVGDAADDKAADATAADEEPADDKAADEKAADEKATDGELADTKSAADAAAEAKVDDAKASTDEAAADAPAKAVPANGSAILEVSGISKEYRIRGRGGVLRAVDNVSFNITRGRTTAIVGESGSGKTTTARMVLGLVTATSGTIKLNGVDMVGLSGAPLRAARLSMQPVFQDPYASLDPMWTVERLIAEPLRAFGIGDRVARRKRVSELLEQVALPAAMAHRYPNELSGGQRQRVAIARALAIEPQLVVCDEAVSALDVLVQDQILTLLASLQERLGVSYLFISHDLAVVRALAHEVVVMRDGRVVEQGPVEDVLTAPADPYTRQLLDAIPGAGVVGGPEDDDEAADDDVAASVDSELAAKV
ncbi:ATP-binding cassette domain-containing protein [Nocardia sp. NPDC051321]|uniref:ABC transporter ATP-binding protein n=1 Tax=Nocardia sp. NPDC051321 TaxID=3364323 RepID=UPI00378BDCA6